MTGLTLGAGAVGIGLAVLAGIVSALATEHMEAKNRVDGFTNALKGSAEQTSLAAREQAALNLQQSGALGIAEKYGIALSTLTEASLGDSRAREQMTEKIVAQADAIKTQLDRMTNWEKDQSAAGRELSAQYAVLMGDLKSLTGDVDDNAIYGIFRQGRTYIDPETEEFLGINADDIGGGEIVAQAAHGVLTRRGSVTARRAR